MKHLISLLLVLGLVASANAQVFNTNGTQFNQAQVVYYKSGFKASTANDTTNYISIAGASDFKVFGTADDSTTVLVYYRLRNSTTGAVTAFASLADTIGTDGAGTAPTATGPAALLERTGGAVALSTLLGFDEVQFFVDYLTGCTTGIDGTDAVLKVFLFLVPSAR